ncbi:MAG: T9SS type A sorting domain-containing protein [candidate division WOR-3 bacterium]
MKKIIVIFFIFLLSSAEWQKREEITLPKGLSVSDIKVGNDGKIWILSKSSLSQIDYTTKGLILFSEIRNAKLFTPNENEEFYLIDNNNSLSTLTIDGQIRNSGINLINPIQIENVQMDKRNIIAISEGNKISFAEGNEIISTLNTNVEKFSILLRTEEAKNEMTLFTMANNQIYAWIISNLNNPATYRSQIIFSASERILDFATGKDGRNYILFKDSILVLNPNGEHVEKIMLDNIDLDSKVFVHPADNNLILFNRFEKTLKILSRTTQTKTDIIILNKNRPNPVDNYTEFEFTINEPMSLTLTVYNLIGKPVKVVASGYYSKGTYIIPWHADDDKGVLVPNGVYFYRLESKKGVVIKQLIVLR